MSQIDLHSSFQPAIAPYVPPPPPEPVVEAAPATAPTLDQNQIQTSTQPPESFDMGALPWATAAEAPAEAAVAEEGAVKAPPLQENPAFQELSEVDKQTLTSLLAEATAGLDPAAAETVNAQLSQMLTDGKLTAVDAFGKRTMDHLSTFNGSGLTRNLSSQTTKGEVARELIQALASPGALTQGDGTLSCAEATLEATLAFTQPADYARIAVGLATRGSVAIPGTPSTHWDDGRGPEVLSAAPSFEKNGRSTLSSLMQDSFKAKVLSRSSDDFGYLGNVHGSGRGLEADQVAMLYDGILGKNHLTVYAKPGVDLTPGLGFALENAPGSVVKVTMRSDTGLHGVAVTGVSEKGVDVWDPATGEITTFPKDEFNRLAVRATLDTSAFLKESHDKGVQQVQAQAMNDLLWQGGDGYRPTNGVQQGEERGGRVSGSGSRR